MAMKMGRMDDENDTDECDECECMMGATLVGKKLSTCRYKIPAWQKIKVDMDPIEGCSCNLDRARACRTPGLSDHHNPHPGIALEHHRNHGRNHHGQTFSSWSPCPYRSRPGGRTLSVPLHLGDIWTKDDEALLCHNTRPWRGRNKSHEMWNFHHNDDHDHDHNHDDGG